MGESVLTIVAGYPTGSDTQNALARLQGHQRVPLRGH